LGSCSGRGWSPAALRGWHADVDRAAIRLAEHRRLTQHLAGWLDEQTVPDGSPLAGVQFASRHGDELALWVVFERVDDTSALTSCTTAPARCSTPHDPELTQACSCID